MHTLLIIGSPKGTKSTSYQLGSHLLRRLETRGSTTETIIVGSALKSEADTRRMLEAADRADLLVFSFPLYVDQLPAPLIEALGHIAEHQKNRTSPGARRVAAIVQCGFPETIQNRPACAIMEQFASESGFEWAGALAMGMGGAIGGRSLNKAGGKVRNVVKGFELAADALASGKPIPAEAIALAGKPFMPKAFYLLAANFGMKHLAKKAGVRGRVYDHPYDSADH
ncbi:MAG: NAD(P)H-dependent oxidoreductase [Candidatus Aminicenantales bacterium]